MGKISIKKETEMKTSYTPSKDNKKHVGFVYMRIYIKNGMIYIGESSNMLDRQYHWRSLKVVYGGKRIEEARKTLGVSDQDWMWDILEKVEADSADELKKKLKEEEAKYILMFKSYDEEIGFNSTHGLSEYLKEANAA